LENNIIIPLLILPTLDIIYTILEETLYYPPE